MAENNTTKGTGTNGVIRSIKKKRKLWLIITAVVLVFGGAFAYFHFSNQTAEATSAAEAPMQTATVRQSDLVVSASGSGTLIAKSEVELAFRGSGQITSILVSVGDQVEAGQLLATLDNTLAQINLIEAQRNYNEMVSNAAILEAEQAVITAESTRDDAWEQLATYISRSVLTWEERVSAAEEALAAAEAAGDQDAVTEAQSDLAYANRSLDYAWNNYYEEYLPTYYEVEVCEGEGRQRTCDTQVWGPSDATINEARTELAIAYQDVEDAQVYLTALETQEIPEGATGSQIASLESAMLNLRTAEYNLEATMLYAPFSGTVLSVDGQVGASASGAVVTIADLSQPYLEIYLDETDWDKIDVNYEVEVIFDSYPDEVYTGYVIQVDPQLLTEQNVSVVRAIVALEVTAAQAEHSLVIGSNAAVEVIAGKAESAMVVPVEALRSLGDGEYMVFVVDDDGNLTPRSVEVGLIDVTYAEIISGLEMGERVSTGIVEVE